MATYVKPDLSSQNKFYELEMRNLGLGELKTISANIKMGSIDDMLEVLKDTIKGEEFGEILMGDVKDLIVWSRLLTTNDDKMPIGFKCSDKKCGYLNMSEEIDLNVFEKVLLNDDLKLVNELVLSNGEKVFIELEKIKHKALRKDLTARIAGAQEDVVKDTVLTKFEGKLTNSVERYHFLTDPDNTEIATEIDDFINRKCFFGLIDFAFHKCPKCGGVSQISLRFRGDSFTKLKFLRDIRRNNVGVEGS